MAEVTVISSHLLNKEKYYLPEGIKSTNCGHPIMGVDVQILDENLQEITESGKEGNIVLKLPGPLTMAKGFWTD
jgi:acyl-coenzyme A synthetase/AMP-(fatty) acid ligase